MRFSEEAVAFDCGGETLFGVVAIPEDIGRVGVLIVVGGPQYRAGSHRQFVLLSRFLAGRGIACIRFDYRGMGDATGAARDFSAVEEDIDAAVGAFLEYAPGVDRVVLWGLCDGASAACFYSPKDPRIVGAVFVNPWVRTEAGQAQTYLKHYYRDRLTDLRFWKKLLRGGIRITDSVGSLLSMARKAGRPAARKRGDEELPERMSASLAKSGIPFAVMLSGRDYVAREFEQEAQKRRSWRELLNSARAEMVRFEFADHTFSSQAKREALAVATWEWLVRRKLTRRETAQAR